MRDSPERSGLQVREHSSDPASARPAITVTLNAAIDHTRLVADLDADESGAPLVEEHRQAGGKGINVARGLLRLGHPARALVVIGGNAGRWIVEDLQRAGIDVSSVDAPGESRTCLEIVERDSGRVRQIHGQGVQADPVVAQAVLEEVESLLHGAAWLAICGRQASGLPNTLSAELVRAARRHGVRCSLDTSSPPLISAWEACPDLVRVNSQEAAEALETVPEALGVPPYGPRTGHYCVVSAGSCAFFAWEGSGRVWRIEPPEVDVRNTIGCGDAMHAGLVAALCEGRSFEAALRSATALAAADAEASRAGAPDPERAQELIPSVRVTRIR